MVAFCRIPINFDTNAIHGCVDGGRRIPFGWPGMQINPNAPIRAQWDTSTISGGDTGSITLRVKTATHSNVMQHLRICFDDGTESALMLPLTNPLQPFEVAVSLPQFLSGGASISASEAGIVVLASNEEAKGAGPHFLIGSDPGDPPRLVDFLRSDNSLQGFHWMEACVLDGLMDLGFKTEAERHLARFFDSAGSFVGENIWGKPSGGELLSVENQGCFAALALLDASHPGIDQVLKFWFSHKDPVTGQICDGGTAAESSYSVAYPLMVIGVERGRADWRCLALQQLRINQEALVGPDGEIWLRRDKAGNRTFRGWARGVCWYLLGLARTLRAAPRDERDPALISELQRALCWILKHRRSDGLWSNFVEDHSIAVDTSGSAGIAAALQIAINEKFFDSADEDFTGVTASALESFISADGCMRGAAQSNNGGESLQRGDLRVLAPFASGLMAQLLAAQR